MPKAVKQKHGYMDCPGCQVAGRKTRVLVRVNAQGTKSYNCDECDSGDYAKPGTQKAADWDKRITPIAPAASSAASSSTPPKEEKKPAQKKDKETAPAASSAAAMPWLR